MPIPMDETRSKYTRVFKPKLLFVVTIEFEHKELLCEKNPNEVFNVRRLVLIPFILVVESEYKEVNDILEVARVPLIST